MVSTNRLFAGAASAVLAASAVTACGSGTDTGTDGSTASASVKATPGSADDLAGVCPKTVVWQTGWVPQAEHGPVYQMLASSYHIDAAHKRVTGELIDNGVDTGVKLQVRAGGPAIGYQSVSAAMYLDKSILIGGINTDESIQDSRSQPTVGIVTYDQLSPLMIMWDPKTHPTWNTIADIGKTDTKVLYFDGTTYMTYLTGSGVLKSAQIDGSYDGTPSVFIAGGKKSAVQGYATQDPYLYQHDIKQYQQPVKYQLVNDLGYSIYPDEVSVRAADLTARAGCLKRLVPVIQRAAVAFHGSPQRAEDLIVKLSSQYDIGSPQSPGLVSYGTATQKSIGMLANGPHHVVGEFDPHRVQHLIDVDAPIFAAEHKPVKAGLTAAQVVTNQFVDRTIGIK